MKKWAFIVCIAMLAVSCNSLLSSKPSGTLSEKQMTDVLVDIHLTEATLRIANDSLARLSDTNELRKRFAQVFEKNDVTPDNFNASLNYYLEHIEELDNIYVDVINRLTELEASLLPKISPTVIKPGGSVPGQPSTFQNNQWFRTFNRTIETEEIKYFDEVKYPVSSNRKILDPKPTPLK